MSSFTKNVKIEHLQTYLMYRAVAVVVDLLNLDIL